jgi:hypothetical protein
MTEFLTTPIANFAAYANFAVYHLICIFVTGVALGMNIGLYLADHIDRKLDEKYGDYK